MRRTSRETIKSRQNIVPSPSVWNYARKGQIPWWWPTDRWVSDSEFLVGSQLPCRCGAAFVVARQRGQMTEKKGTNIKLKGKIALITGGAQGLGKAIALAMANEGANIVIGDIRATRSMQFRTLSRMSVPGPGCV